MCNELEKGERLEALKNAFEESHDGLHIIDNKGRTLLINKACERIEGITKEDIGDKTIGQLVKEGYYDESVTLMVLEQKKEITRLQRAKNGKILLVTGIPIYDGDKIARVVVNSRDITELSNLREELQKKERLLNEYKEQFNSHLDAKFVTNSKCMESVFKMALDIAKVNSNVLITGESGVGKSIIAEFIHNNSYRKDKAFIKIDCGAIPDNLFESELFGYEGGAFTGADAKGKMGLVQMADGGTLFLDEIGEIPISIQSKLLRFIQEKKFYRIGGKAPIEIDVRIISATNRDLEQMVSDKIFREDLLYRINVIPIEIPPLRNRKEDIPILVVNRINSINDEYGLNKKISGKAMDKLIEYSWPGNIRELENIVERVLVTAQEDNISVEDLPAHIRSNSQIIYGGRTYKELISAYEHDLFEHMIMEGHTPLKIAEILSMDVTTVRRKLHKYEIQFK